MISIDTCKIWKIGENIRMDYTFDDFKSFRIIRIPRSYILRKKNDKYEVFVLNWKDRNFFNPFEGLEEDEKKMIINDIINIQRVSGEFKIKSCDIKESRNIFGNLVYEKINDWKGKKYEIAIKSSLNLHNKKRPKIVDLDINSYFDENKGLNMVFQDKDKDIKENIIEGFRVKSDLVKKGLIDNMKSSDDKNLKANVWITDNYPLKSNDLINLISSLGNANEYVGKLKQFFNHPDVKEVLKDGFPVKIKIPVTFFLDIFIAFNGIKYHFYLNFKRIKSRR